MHDVGDYALVRRCGVDTECVVIGWHRDHRALAAADAVMTYRTRQQTTQPDVGWRADDQGPRRLGLLDQDRTGVTFDQLQLPVGARLDLGEKRGDAVSISLVDLLQRQHALIPARPGAERPAQG